MNVKAYVDAHSTDYQSGYTLSLSPVKLLTAFAVVLIFVLFLIWSRINFIAEGYRISSLNQEIQKLEQETDQYNLEMATLKSRSRIESIAKNKLHLVYAAPDQVILLNR